MMTRRPTGEPCSAVRRLPHTQHRQWSLVAEQKRGGC